MPSHKVQDHILPQVYFLEQFFDEQGMSLSERYDYCLKAQESRDVCLGFVKSADYSKGMEIEFEKAMEIDQRYVLAIKEGLSFDHFREGASDVIEYSSLQGLCGVLGEFEF